MKTNYSEIEALQRNKYIESKFDMIPAELKNIYSEVSGKETLVARELRVDGHVVIGIEYAPNGDVVCAYTADKKGKRINLENAETRDTQAPKDLISRRLDEVAERLAQNKTTHVEEPKTVKKPTKRVVPTTLKAPKREQRA